MSIADYIGDTYAQEARQQLEAAVPAARGVGSSSGGGEALLQSPRLVAAAAATVGHDFSLKHFSSSFPSSFFGCDDEPLACRTSAASAAAAAATAAAAISIRRFDVPLSPSHVGGGLMFPFSARKF